MSVIFSHKRAGLLVRKVQDSLDEAKVLLGWFFHGGGSSFAIIATTIANAIAIAADAARP